MLNIPVKFEDLLKVVDMLSPEQKRILRQHVEENWATRLDQSLSDIHADMPTNIAETELQADIEAAIASVRANED